MTVFYYVSSSESLFDLFYQKKCPLVFFSSPLYCLQRCWKFYVIAVFSPLSSEQRTRLCIEIGVELSLKDRTLSSSFISILLYLKVFTIPGVDLTILIVLFVMQKPRPFDLCYVIVCFIQSFIQCQVQWRKC